MRFIAIHYKARCDFSMVQLLRMFGGLAFLRYPPQVFPRSGLLLALAALAYWCMAMVKIIGSGAGFDYAVMRSILSFFNLLAGAWLILALAKRNACWHQTVTALLGGEAVIGLVTLPLLGLTEVALVNPGFAMVFLAVLIWEVAFFAHVYKHALEKKDGMAILITVGYFVASMMLKNYLLPFPEEAP